MSEDSDFEDFDEFIRELDVLYRKLSRKLSKQIKEIEKMVERETACEDWGIRTIDGRGVRGFITRKRFENPLRDLSKGVFEAEFSEPLIDVFENKKSIRIYMELPGLALEQIELMIFDGKIEVKADDFHKIIPLPTRKINSEKARAIYKNGILKIRIPKIGRFARPKREKYRIRVVSHKRRDGA